MRISCTMTLATVLLFAVGCTTEIRSGGIGGSTPPGEMDDTIYIESDVEMKLSKKAAALQAKKADNL